MISRRIDGRKKKERRTNIYANKNRHIHSRLVANVGNRRESRDQPRT